MPAAQGTKRSPGTKRDGGSFDAKTVQAVWEKARALNGVDAKEWRVDKCNALIKRGEHGNVGSKYGWEVDHVKPVAKGGGDELSNLQPLQWENNRHKGDSDEGAWTCKVT